MKKSIQGGLLMTVMISTAIVGLVAGSVASLISYQRKAGIRQQLKLHSMNTAEAAIDYAFAYVTNDANFKGLDQSTYIPTSSGSPLPFTFPSDALSFLKNKNPMPASAKGTDPIDFSDIKVTVMPRPATQKRIYKDPATTDKSDPNRGQWVYEETITMVSSVTASLGGIKQTSYARKDINYNITNLFQHAVFYQGQLHLHRGFKVMGSVHTNGNMIMNTHNGDRAIYNGFVAAGNRFYRGSIIDMGSGCNAYGLVPELANGDLDPAKFTIGEGGTGDGTVDTTPSTTPPLSGDIPIYIETPSTNTFRYRFLNQSTDSRMTNWKDTASKLFLGYLQDISHSVPIINPIGALNYNMDPINPIKNGAYFLIEPLLPPTHTLRTETTNPQKTNYRYNLSANASLVLRVEFAARNSSGILLQKDPNIVDMSDNTTWYCPTSAYGASPLLTPLPISQDPSRYLVRAYKKPASATRANDPNSTSDRVAIPFPTDVIGRADYKRTELSGTFAYSSGTEPAAVDILGTEPGITTLPSPNTYGRVTTDGTNTVLVTGADISTATKKTAAFQTRFDNEAWHRYRIEAYYPVSTAALVQGYSTSYSSVLSKIGTPLNPRVTPTKTVTTATDSYPLYGMHDSRLGRGVHLLTLDIGRLREIMEADSATVTATYGPEAKAFRDAFNNGTSEWNGIIYVEFPTSTKVIWSDVEGNAAINRAPSGSVYRNNSTFPGYTDAETNPAHKTTDKSYLDTYRFDYGNAETRYPLRSADTSTITRADKIVPIAPEFRRYPSTVDSNTITDPANAILGLQVVNAKKLPKVTITKFDGDKSNVLNAGFTLATNVPLYLVGSWNADGDYTTGTKVTSLNPNDYATTDAGNTGNSDVEIPSAIFCDTFTVLSPGWATQTSYKVNSPETTEASGNTRRQNSFYGWTDSAKNSLAKRKVTFKNANERIEVSACIATGDYPVFEFFPHALEDFRNYDGTNCTSLVVKGAMVAMFTSEIQHIKTAYGRSVTSDIQTYYQGHGAYNFPSPRLHQFILEGNFPPGTPQALVPSQSNFQVILKSDPLVSAAGL